MFFLSSVEHKISNFYTTKVNGLQYCFGPYWLIFYGQNLQNIISQKKKSYRLHPSLSSNNFMLLMQSQCKASLLPAFLEIYSLQLQESVLWVLEKKKESEVFCSMPEFICIELK